MPARITRFSWEILNQVEQDEPLALTTTHVVLGGGPDMAYGGRAIVAGMPQAQSLPNGSAVIQWQRQ